jgi:hypothetical protein
LQRQLIGLLRNLGPDILIATHSTEIVTEAEPGEIVLINKKKRNARRISNQADIESVFKDLGSNVNPILTQLAKTRKALFVEGLDFQIISKFARRIQAMKVANRSSFAVIPMQGFNPDRARNLKEGIELTLGAEIKSAAILDRDYRSTAECNSIISGAEDFCQFVRIHERKEIENFLLIPSALDRAIEQRIADRKRRTGKVCEVPQSASEILTAFAAAQRPYVMSRHIALWVRYQKDSGSKKHPDILTEEAINWFEAEWARPGSNLCLIPGKDALSVLNKAIQEQCAVSIAPSGIITAMSQHEVPIEMISLIDAIGIFVASD